MPTLQEYAALSALIYNDQRGDGVNVNKLTPPLGWSILNDASGFPAQTGFDNNLFSFTAGAYINQETHEIVISYKGTDFLLELTNRAWNTAGDMATDVAAGLAKSASFYQFSQAALYYQAVKQWAVNNGYSASNISFTGHSLGGGLASAMSVWFDRSATTFAEAPFEPAATDKDLLLKISVLLAAAGLVDSSFSDYIFDRIESPNGGPIFNYRQALVGNYYVRGEFLSYLRKSVNTVYGSDNWIDIGDQSITRALALHSMNLHLALICDDRLRIACNNLPDLIPILLDTKVYASDPNSKGMDFITKLVADQVTGDLTRQTGILGKFVGDINKITTDGGTISSSNVRKALIVAAMDYYYLNNPANATSLFSLNGNAINFNYDDIGIHTKSKARLVNAVNNLLPLADQELLNVVTDKAEQHEDIGTGLLGRQNAWHIQTGDGAMTWSATGSNKDAAIGGSAGDTLDGGAGDDILIGLGGADSLLGGGDNDILLGGEGSDTLDGGTGEDTLSGGNGSDTYHFAAGWNHDTIDDSDGQGSIQVDGIGSISGDGAKKVAEGVWQTDDKKINFTLVARDPANNDLYVTFSDRTDVIQIRNWSSGNLGISLSNVVAQPAQSNPMVGDYKKKTNEAGTAYLIGSDGNYVPNGDDPGAADLITGTSGADSIQGLGGNDALLGRLGDDFIDGGDGSDVIQGGLGADTLKGGTGDDVIYGSSSGALQYPTDAHFQPPASTSPVLLARGFNWVIDSTGLDSDGFQQSYLTLTVNRDEQAGDSGNIIDGGSGNDLVFAGTGSDVVHGGDDNDDIYGMAGGDMLFGDAGNDRIRGDGPDTTDASRVNATLAAQHGADVISGGAGKDLLMGQGSNDELYGGADNDTLYGDDRDTIDTPAIVNGNDYLDGGNGADKLVGGGRDDELFGGSGNDSLWGDAGATEQSSTGYIAPQYQGDDYLDGEDGDDYLQGEGGNDTLFGGKDNDTLFGDDSVSRLPGANQGADYLDGEDGNDALVGGGGSDTLFGGIGDDHLDGDDVDSSVPIAFQGDDYLDGEAGSDTLMGRDGNDTLLGGADTDRLDGGDGDDLLDGGSGGDDMRGGNGDDTYVIGAGEASDSVHADSITDTQGQDVIEWDGVDLGSVQVIQTGNDLALTPDASQVIYIVNGLTSSIATVRSGGAEVSLQALVGRQLTTVVTATTDRADSNLLGGANDDQLTIANSGAQVWGGHGSDTIKVNTGQGATVNMTVGDGTDQVIAVHRDTPNLPTDPVPQNILRLGQGFDGSQLKLFKVGAQSYVLSLNDQGDGARFDAVTNPDGTIAAGEQPFDIVQLSNGSQFSWQDILTRGISVLPSATSGNDVLSLSPIGDVMDGLDGNDSIEGLAGNDVLFGGQGNDTLVGGMGDDTLYANSGVDLLVGGDGKDVLYTGNDSAYDVLQGGEGDDKYFFRHGYYINVDAQATDASLTSNDDYRILDSGHVGGGVLQTLTIADAGGDNDSLHFESSLISPANTKVISTGTGYKITSWNLTVDIQNAVDAMGNKGPGSVESVVFYNGTIWTADQLRALSQQTTSGNDTVVAFGGDDVIDGGAGDDRLDGGGGNDSVLGGAGYDILNGGAGSDTLDAGADGGSLIGDAGNDTYVVRAGQGNVFLGAGSRAQAGDAGYDVLKVQANAADVTTSYVRGGTNFGDYDRVVVSWKDASAAATFNLYGTQVGASDAVEEIQFSDGSIINVAQYVSAAMPLPTTGDDTLQLSSLDDSISAGDGADVVYGYAGNDTLLGGIGHDVLYAGHGDDVVDGGAGDDDLYLGGGNDTVAFGFGSGHDALMSEAGLQEGESGTVLMNASVSATDVHLRWIAADFESTYDEAGAYSGYLPVASGSLSLSLGAGADQITTTLSAVGSLQSTISAVQFQGGATWNLAALLDKANTSTDGNDLLVNAYGRDSLQGGAGNDTLYAFNANTALYGGQGEDSLIGGDFNDTLVGGAGNDTLYGYAGTNTVSYQRGDGGDVVTTGYGGQSILSFGAGIDPADVTFVHQTFDLIVRVAGGGSITFSPVKSLSQLPVEIQFSNGVVWDSSQIQGKLLNGSIDADVLSGFFGDDSITGGSGNDSLTGYTGNDTLVGGSGDDTLIGDGYSSYWSNTGQWDQDLLIGGAGDDLLTGGLGYNTFHFDTGFGHDTIVGASGHNASAPTIISFGPGIAAGSVRCSYGVNGRYVLSVPSTGDAVEFYPGTNDQIHFADGTIWTSSDLASKAVYSITEVGDLINGSTMGDAINALGGSDYVSAGDGNDSVRAGRGDDEVHGDAGNDTLIGGAGNDLLLDSSGDDRYEYQVGDGSDQIVDSAGVNDVLALGTGITSADVWVLTKPSDAANGNYTLLLPSSADSIRFKGIDSVVFTDGTVWSASYVDNLARTGKVTSGNDVINGTVGADRLFGYDGNDKLNGLAGNDWLNGGAGSDTMVGSTGDDTYIVDVATDVVTELPGEGTDTVQTAISYSLASIANVENLTLVGTSEVNATGNSLANVLTGNVSNNTLDGGAGTDILVGGAGNDTYVIDVLTDVITEVAGEGIDTVRSDITFSLASVANVENLTLTGAGAVNGTGNSLANTLVGNAGNNVLDGGAGNDTLIGGAGDDFYVVDSTSDVVTEYSGEGSDTVQTSVTYSLGANVENLILTGTDALRTLTGNVLRNKITGSSANDTLDGGAGIDTLIGGEGDDRYLVDDAGDVIFEGLNAGMDWVVSSAATYTLSENIDGIELAYGVYNALSGVGNDTSNELDGNEFNNTLTGMGGNDTLSGDSGDDTLIGGLGDDTYWVDSAADVITEYAGEGYEQVVIYGTANYALGANLEKGTAQINFTGTTLVGNADGNFLIGSNYADTIIGGDGFDVLSARNGNDSLSGGQGNDTLDGGVGNDTLDGGVGDDSMTGGSGNDTFIVDANGDTANEAANGGTDTVLSSISYTLGSNVENLTLTGSDSYRAAIGNALNNLISGSSGADMLDGGLGADILVGGDGDDDYVVDDINDVITETASGGGDSVTSSAASYTLSANVESLSLAYGIAAALGATGNNLANELDGNEFNNTLTGLDGNDTLIGNEGDDTMIGGAGDDTYWVDSANDVVTELAGEGNDQVIINGVASYALSGNVEKGNAQLNTVAITLDGNVNNNSLIGSNYADVMHGDAGNDTLSGGKGNDSLYGGEGNDSYYGQIGADALIDTSTTSSDTYNWGRGQGADSLLDSGGTDQLSILSGVTADQIWLRHVSNNLEVSVIGTTDTFTINNWYASSANQVETFKLADNKTLTAANVQSLVDAMAAFAPPAAGQTTLPTNYQSTLNPVIASSWV